MDAANLELPSGVYQRLLAHLLRPKFRVEQAAFVYAKATRGVDGTTKFQFIDWDPIPPEGFEIQHEYHIELADEQRAKLIKRAHDLDASLIEFHSHTGHHSAEFSGSDMAGFDEFVPHVWWRLKNRPYAAVVVARSGIDALAWTSSPSTPVAFDAVTLDGGAKIIRPTQLSFQRFQQRGSRHGTI